MNEPIMNIDDLISQYIDGELSGEAEAELHHRLSVSPDDRRRFRAQIVLRGVAGDGRMLERPTPAMRSALFARLENEEGMSAAAATSGALANEAGPSLSPTETDPAPLARPFAADRPASTRRDERSRRRRLVPLLIPFLIGVILTGTIWQFSGRDDDTRALAVGEPQAASSDGERSTTAPYEQRTSTDAGVADAGAANAGAADAGAADAGAANAGAAGAGTSGAHESVGGAAGIADLGAAGDGDDRAGAIDADATAASSARGGGASGSSESSYRAPRSLAAAQGTEGRIAAAEPEASESPRRDARRHSSSTDREQAEAEPLAIASAPASETQPTSEDMMALGNGDGQATAREEVESSSVSGARADGPRMMSSAPPPTAPVDEPMTISAKRSPSRPSPTAISMTDGADRAAASAPARDSLRSVTLTSIMGGDARSPVRIHGASPIELEEPRRSAVFMTGLRQSLLVGTREREPRPELALRLGGEFGDVHAVYGIVGYTTFRESRVRTTSEFRYNAAVPSTEYLYRSEQSQVAENRGEFWAGAGYRINVMRGERWQAGAGAWGGYGQRYARVGADLPVTFVVSRNVRIELTPSVQYVSAHGASVTDASTVTTSGVTDRSVVAEQTEVADSEVRPGIGLGVTVLME